MLIRTLGAKCVGIDAALVTVETHIDKGIGIHLVGLADVAVKESLLRTTTALQAIGYHIPGKRIVINLAPADVHKNGSGYDLPIAVGIIAASEQCDLPLAGRFLLMGELGLDGSVRDVPGGLAVAELVGREGLDGIVLPLNSAQEAAELHGTRVFGVDNLEDVVRILSGQEDCSEFLARPAPPDSDKASDIPDFRDIIGQAGVKRVMESAAAGTHNVCMIGPTK